MKRKRAVDCSKKLKIEIKPKLLQSNLSKLKITNRVNELVSQKKVSITEQTSHNFSKINNKFSVFTSFIVKLNLPNAVGKSQSQ